MEKSKTTIILLAIIAVLMGLLIMRFMTAQAATAPAFDHSQCQYPNRASNPPDGCDNSDPARPECMKFGTEDCDLPTQEPAEAVQETETTIPAPANEKQPEIAPCAATAA